MIGTTRKHEQSALIVYRVQREQIIFPSGSIISCTHTDSAKRKMRLAQEIYTVYEWKVRDRENCKLFCTIDVVVLLRHADRRLFFITRESERYSAKSLLTNFFSVCSLLTNLTQRKIHHERLLKLVQQTAREVYLVHTNAYINMLWVRIYGSLWRHHTFG